MAFPTISAPVASSNTVNATTLTVNLPAGVAAGDLVVVAICSDSAALNHSAPSPWVEIADAAFQAVAVASIYYLIASGGETSVVITRGATERGNALAWKITGWHGTTPPELTAVATSASTTTPDPGSLTPSWGAADTLWLALAFWDDSAAPTLTSYPTNYTLGQGNNVTGTSSGRLAGAARQINAATEDPGVFTITAAEQTAAYTLAVRPAAAAGPQSVTVGGAIALSLGPVTPSQIAQSIGAPASIAIGPVAPVAPTQVAQSLGPGAIALTLGIPAPTILGPITPAAIAITLGLPAPQVNQSLGPAAIAIGPVAPIAPTQIRIAASPAAIALALGFPAPAIAGSLGPPAIVLSIGLPAPAIRAGITPAAIALALGLPAPTVNVTVAPIVVSRLRGVQYHVLVFSPDANGGPGVPKYELDADVLNATWQQGLNFPGQAAFSMSRFNKKLSDFAYMKDHIKIIREDSRATKTVFAGKLVKPQESARDTIVFCWDYTAFLQRSRTGFRILYPAKTLKEIVDAEWNLAKTVADSLFAFVATGTTETPLGLDGVTPIKTNSQFGVIDFDRLFLFNALCEIGMANTSNTVVFEITRETPHTFNFWKDRSVDRTNYHFVYPGNLIDYNLDTGHDQIVNDLATVIADPTSGAQVEYALADTASITDYRRLQDATTIKTLFGLNSGTTESDQQKAALARLLTLSAGIPRAITVFPRQDEITPFDNWDLGDTFPIALQAPNRLGDGLSTRLKVTGIGGAWTPEAGELLQVFLK